MSATTTTDENQHWVPKFLIKNFSDTDGRVFCLNVRTDEVTKPPPKYAAADAGFNNFVMNGVTVSFEDELEKIETAAAPLIKNIINSRSVAGLKQAQRHSVADFMAAQSFRTEAFYKGFTLQAPRQEFGPIFAELWRSAFLLSAEIVRRKWAVMVIDHDDVFYLGDHPLVLQYTENPEQQRELGFDIEGVEAFLPLSPTCALYMPCSTISQQIISGYETALDVPALMRQSKEQGTTGPIDEAKYLELAERVKGSSGALYRSLTEGSAFVATPANVENLNALQCAWAHTAVYSNRRDFSFAKDVFRKSPKYRDLVKVRLAAFGN